MKIFFLLQYLFQDLKKKKKLIKYEIMQCTKYPMTNTMFNTLNEF